MCCLALRPKSTRGPVANAVFTSSATLQTISRKHPTPNDGVVCLLKILTYSQICSVLSSVHALPLGAIYFLEIACDLRMLRAGAGVCLALPKPRINSNLFREPSRSP